MKKAMSWIHLIGCIGWIVFWFVMLAEEGLGNMLDGAGLIASIALLLTSGAGVYLFVVGVNRQLTQLEQIKTENKILEAKLEQSNLQERLASGSTKTNR